MKKLIRGLTALILSVSLTLTPALQICAAQENTSQASVSDPSIVYISRYLEEIFSHYTEYLNSDYSFDKLLTRQNYLHCTWADAVYYKTHAVSSDYYMDSDGGFFAGLFSAAHAAGHNTTAAVSAPITWAGHFLTDTKLDQEAYEDCLSKLLAMHEKGFLQTANNQTEYDVTKSGAGAYAKLGWLTLKTAYKVSSVKLSKLLDDQVAKSLNTTFKTCNLSFDTIGVSREMYLNGMEAYTAALYINLHKERLAFLQAICDCADPVEDQKLIKAAEKMIDVANLRLSGLLFSMGNLNTGVKLIDILGNFSVDKGLDDLADLIGTFVSGAAETLIDKLLDDGKLAENLCTAVKFLGGNVSLVMAGFEIGGAIGSIIWGDAYELFREMIILDQIGAALSSAMASCVTECNKCDPDNDWYNGYDPVYRLVAIGEALCYVRIGGEYSALKYVKWLRSEVESEYEDLKRGKYRELYSDEYTDHRMELLEYQLAELPDSEELTADYAGRAGRLSGCYRALAAIFRMDEPQVIVRAASEHERFTAGDQVLIVDWKKPEVILTSDKETGERITESAELSRYERQIENRISEIKNGLTQNGGNAHFQNEWDCWIDVGMSSVYAAGDALSILMYDSITYFESAHSMKYVYSLNFNTVLGQPLKLADILKSDDPNTKKKLKEKLIQALDDCMNGYSFLGDTSEQIIEKYMLEEPNEKDRDHHWYFSEEGFHVIFDLYEIAPYAAGNPVLTIPYSQLDDIIKEEYFPEDRSDTWTDGHLELLDKTAFSQDDDYAGNADAEVYGDYDKSLHCVVSRGSVYDAVISYRYDSILYYANVMTGNDVVWLEDREKEKYVLVTSGLYWGQTARAGQRIEESWEVENP